MKTEHATFPLSRLPSLATVSQRMMLEPLPCPLCGYAAEHPQSTLDDHIANHLHEFALRCLPWGTCGYERDSDKTKTRSASNSRGLTDEDGGDGDPRYVDMTEADTPTKLHKNLKTTYFRLSEYLSSILSRLGRTIKNCGKSSYQLKSDSSNTFRSPSLCYAPSRPADTTTVKRSPRRLICFDWIHIPTRKMSDEWETQKLRLGSSSSFPGPDLRLLETLKTHLLKITHILNQALLGWGATRQRAAFDLYCEKTWPILKADTASANIKDELVRGWNGLPDRTQTAVREYLSSNAHGLFTWVALVCQQLERTSTHYTLSTLYTFPTGLEFFYGRMMDQLESSDDADCCKRVLGIASTVRRPLTLEELATFLEVLGNISDLESLTDIIGLCGGFLTLRRRTVYFIHASAKEFLLTNASDKVFPYGVGKVNYEIFLKSLELMSGTLRRNMYGLEAPGFPIANIKQPEPDPLATMRYPCIYWVEHFLDSLSEKTTRQEEERHTGIVYSFLEKKCLYWFEALSLFRGIGGNPCYGEAREFSSKSS